MPSRRAAYRVSVIVPVFRSPFLSEALSSIEAQRRSADEVVVVDDGSPDRAHVRALLREHPSVLSIEQPNAGAGAARNAGIRAATGDLVAFLDADDAWYPNFLAAQIRLLDVTGADLVYSDGSLQDASGHPCGRFMDAAPSAGAATLEALLSQRCTVLTSSVVARRDALLAAGLFDPTLRRGQDFELWLRLASHGASIRYQRQPLLKRRVHAQGLSGTTTQELERAMTVLSKVTASLDLSKRQRAAVASRHRRLSGDLMRERGKEWLLRGEYSVARDCLARAHSLTPTWKLRAALLGLRVAPRLVSTIVQTRAGHRHARAEGIGNPLFH